MSPLFNNPAFIHHQNQIRIADSGKSVGNNKAGLITHQGAHGFLDQHFCLKIHIGGCLIQNQQMSRLQHGTGNGHQLFLSLGDVDTILCDDGIIAMGQMHDAAGYRKLARKVEEHEQVKDGILAILHDRLYQLCQYYLGQGAITPNALKNVEYLYRSYHSLGGNGTGTELYTRVTKLPLDLEGVDDNEN